MQYGVFPAGLIASGQIEVMNLTTAVSPLVSSSSFGSMPPQRSQQEEVLQSLRGYTTSSSNGILSTQNTATVENNPEAMEIMTIPVFRDSHENYSGEGKNHIEESYTQPEVSISPSSPQRGISEEERDTDGSGGNYLFISSNQKKQVTLEAFEEQKVLIQTTVQWKLLDLPTEQPSHSTSVFKDASVPEEARGEILYMHPSAEKSVNVPSKIVKIPLVMKKLNTHAPNASDISPFYMPTTSELAPKASSATDQRPSSKPMTTLSGQIQTTDLPIAGDTVFNTDSSLSVTWLPVVQEETQEPQTHTSTPVTSVKLETTGYTVRLTAPYVKETSQLAPTELETQLVPSKENTSGDHTSQAKVDYENDSSVSSGEFLLLCFIIIFSTQACATL